MQLDFLAFGAHPDDAELFVGGTLAKLSDLGYATGVVDMSRGELGTRGTAAVRGREAREAARILGLAVRENLGLPDGRITVTDAARLSVIRVLRKYRPRIVATHYREDRHPDHVHTSRLVAEAVHHSGLARIRTGQARYRPPVLLFFKLPWNVAPSFLVDVGDWVGRREAAIAAHRSQLYDPASRRPDTYLSQPDFLERVDSIHAWYGTLVGKRRAEAFHIGEALEISDPVAHFAR
ncbi:MAG: bacillithiol biosynthesis deacetylase BshB1 [Acidobacteria bacterium]|nr:bacillithiol biosynthesis deacetylase BshB1 [Acidobacteriota bacterium]